MKNIALVLLSITTAVFAGLYFHEGSKVAQAEGAAQGLQQKVVALQATGEEQEQKSASLRAELKQAQADTAARDAQIARLSAAAANPAAAQGAVIGGLATAQGGNKGSANSGNPLSALSKMFEDPQMKEAIVAQQKAAMSPMMQKMYGKLFSDLGLSADQSAALKEMLLNKHMSGAETGLSMISGESGSVKMEELGKKVKASSDAADAEIKSFLGDDKYEKFKAYEKTTADRMVVGNFKDQLNGAAALTPEQEQQLIDAMTQERQNFKFTVEPPDKAKATGDFSAMFNEESVNKMIQDMDQLNQHFVGQAQNILTPEQLEAFQKYLNGQQALQKMGMQMGAKMFAPKQGQ